MDELIDTEMGLVEVEPIQAQDVTRAERWRKLMVQGFGKSAPNCIDDILLDMARHYAMHRAEEREACAKVAEDYGTKVLGTRNGLSAITDNAARAIRNRTGASHD